MSILKKNIVALIIILTSVAILTFWIKTKPTPKKTEVKERLWAVNAVTVKKQALSPELKLYGKVESPFNSTISAVIAADVKSLLALEGQQVNGGQVLIKLDPKDVELQVKQSQADVDRVKVNLNNNRKELVRKEALFKKKVISSSAIDKLRQIVASLEADLKRAKASLALIKNSELRSKVVAPFTGRITKVFVAPGDRVNPGTKLVSMYSTNNLEVRTQLPNNMLGKFRDLWSKGKLISAMINGKTSASLSRITGEVKSNSAGIDALFKIAEEDNSLSLGRAVQLIVKLPKVQDAMFLPYEAFYNRDAVYSIKDSRLRLVKIDRLGQLTINGITYVLIDASKFIDTDKIMLTQLPNAVNGLKVNIVTLDNKVVLVSEKTSKSEDKIED